MLLRKVVLMLALGLACSSAMAEWTKVGTTEHGAITHYANLSSISRVGNLVKMWNMTDFKTPQYIQDVKNTMSTKELVKYDCKQFSTKIVYFASYSENVGRGQSIGGNEISESWTPVIPDSIDEDMWKIACKKH